MAKLDPHKTARNKRIKELSEELEQLQLTVLGLTECHSVFSLHGKMGSKNALFIDVRQAIIHTPAQYQSLWMEGCMRHLDELKERGYRNSAFQMLVRRVQTHKPVLTYLMKFLERTFLREYDNLTKVRPTDDAAIWMGQNDAEYGLLVTPRFRRGEWENDKSEIRRFPKDYWTIGHVLHTGLVVPAEDEVMEFTDVEHFLSFYRNVLVRHTRSRHQLAIADRYREFVRNADDAEKVPLLIPELRYLGPERQHKYRLDFCIVHPFTLQKVGFELSPWSSHGVLTGVAKRAQSEVNDEARENFEREMRRHKEFFRRHGITVLIYTDEDLRDSGAIFSDIEKQLLPQKKYAQLKIFTMRQFLSYEV